MLPVTATYYNNQTSSTSTLLCASSLLPSSSNTHYFLCNPSIRECLKHGQHGTRKCAKILEKNLGYVNWPRGSKLLTAKCEHPSISEQMHANVSYLFISHENPKLCWIVSFWSLKIVKLTTHAAWPQENMAQGKSIFSGDDLLKQKPKHCPSPATFSSCWENSVWPTMVTNTWFNSKAKSSSTTSMITATQNKPFALATLNYDERKGRSMTVQSKVNNKM